MAERPLFYIVDGHAIAYRQYHALQVSAFSTSQGEPTNAIYGFARTILDILQRDKPRYLAITFDMGLSGRDTLYGEYKGTREKMPDDLARQIDRIQQLVQAFNIPLLAYEGYEADDVIGTVAAQADAQNIELRIVTGDRDLLQLLNDHVTVKLFFPMRGVPDLIYDAARFREEYGGLEPHQLIDLKALMGDSSDNIPGVEGIGKTGALKLIQAYGSIENLYDHLDEIKGSQGQKLAAGRDSAFLSKNLATIRQDAPVSFDLQNCVAQDYDAQKVDAMFRELEFNSLRNRLPKTEQLPLFAAADNGQDSTPPADEAVCETVIVRDQTTLGALVNTLNSAQAIAFDTETTAIDRMVAELVGISVAVNGDTGYYIPVGHKDSQQLPLQTVLDAIRPAFTNPAIPKYAHNAEYDLVMLQRNGVDVTPITFDTMIAEWLRRPDSDTLGLKRLALQELNVHMTEIRELIGTGKKQVTMDAVPVEKCAPYAAADAAITFRLVDKLRPALEQEQLIKLFEELELPLIPVIAAIEQAGVVLDIAYLRQLSNELSQRLSAVETEIHALSGGYGGFNINSPKQLNDVLFGKLGLPTEGLRKTTHGFSTDAAVLDSLRGAHPIIEKILEYREITKLKGTYVDALPQLINPHTGRVHTDFNQTGAATGRLSSSNPNLQNIPNRTEEGRKIRRAFLAPKDMKLLSVDYSQIELRILAHVSQDAMLLEAFHQGQDIHAATAAVVYGVPLDQISKEQRTLAKRINFGLIYGMGAHRLARESNLTYAEAERFIKTYFERLPGVLVYLESTKQQARTKEGLSTLFGRRRFFPLLFQHYTLGNRINMQVVQAEERVAINFPIQGTAADIIKRAMIDIYHDLNARQSNAHMILQVHDELVFEVPENELVETAERVVHIMESACDLDAPLRANAQAGDNWCDMDAV